MPFVFQKPQDDPYNQTIPSGGGGTLLGQGAPGAGPGLAKPAGAPSQSGWTNLRSYLDANQDQAGGLAGQVAGNIQQQGQQAQGALNSAASGYNADVEKAHIAPDDQFIQGAGLDPAGFVKNPTNVSKFNAMKSGQFAGPGLFEETPGYQDMFSQVGKAGDMAAGASTEGGRRNLVEGLSPNPTAGKTDLNSLLLSGNAGARQQVVDAASPYAGLRDFLKTTTATADATRGKAIADQTAAQKQVQDQFIAPQTTNLQNIQNDITGRVNTSAQDAAKKAQAIADMRGYISGTSNLNPNQEETDLFFGAGSNPTGYDDAKVRNAVIQALTYKDANGVTHIEGSNDPGQQEGIYQSLADYVKGGADHIYPHQYGPQANYGMLQSDFEKKINPVKGEAWKYGNPLTYLSGAGRAGQLQSDFMDKYFPGTSAASGNPTPASAASPQEAAKILALQKLIGTQTPFLNPEDEALAGTYKPAKIGQWAGF